MGVDARILLKITNPTSWVDSKQLRQISARLADTIGYREFFIDPEKDRHAISFVSDDHVKYPEDYEQVMGKPYVHGAPAVWFQDGDEIIAQPNEQFLEVHLYSRYYGEEYARGDWTKIFFVLMWCVYNIPNVEVWYGGDSSGICAEHMTSERMNRMTQFYLTSGNETYWMNQKTEFKCDFCQRGVVNSGGGGTSEFYHCDSCGGEWYVEREHGLVPKRQVTRWGDEPTDDKYSEKIKSFEMSSQVKEGKRSLYPFDGTFRIKYPFVPKDTTTVEVLRTLPAAAKRLGSGE